MLDADDGGLFAVIGGGAIDWSGHADKSATSIEETLEFNAVVETVVDWVNHESSWDETLSIVTADYETGYLPGAGSNPTWTIVSGTKGEMPAVAMNSADHTNELVPVYAKGPGSAQLLVRVTRTDPARGAYPDNTDLANVLLTDFWANTSGHGHGHHHGR